VLQVISGQDEKDSTSVKIEVPEYLNFLPNTYDEFKKKKPVIGIPKEYFTKGLNEEIRKAIEFKIQQLQKNGFEVLEITLPNTEYCIATYYILTTAEASSNLARFDGARYGFRHPNSGTLKDMYNLSRSEGFGAEVKRRIMLGTYVLSAGYYDAYYRKAQKVRRLFKNDFDNAFQKVDLLLTPVAPTTAFRIGEKSNDPLEMYLGDIYTLSANLAGIPGISIPVGKDSQGLPIGMQLMANQFEELSLLRMSYYIQNHLL
jgi:aspartyl-tRNA(Asn)/glutamyl-tRNA(Gln) amidotransferase subunit A